MKHYCNRRMPKNQNIKSSSSPDAEINSVRADDIILPPMSELPMPADTYINEYTDIGQGGAFNQGSGYTKELSDNMQSYPPAINQNIIYDNMQGKFDLISVPHENNGLTSRSMTTFLDRYIGKLICLDLWTSECNKEEMCGTLIETGKNYIVINIHNTDKVIMIDLRSIRYVSIYCR